MASKNVLGKGLSALLPAAMEDAGVKKSFSCGIEELHPNRYQPRKTFHDDKQKDLVASIKSSGIIQPIVVRKAADGYEIIAGERRWRAAQAAGLKEVPILIREATDQEAAEMTLIENIQREELNPLEEADAYKTLMDSFNLSQEEISTRVGKDRSTIANTLRLLKLPPQIKTALTENKISAGHARCLLACSSEEEQMTVLNLIIKKDLNVRETERLIQKLKKKPATGKSLSPAKDHFLDKLEKSLSKKLQAKVMIHGSYKKGIIEVQYTSLDELNRLSGLILDELP